MVNVYAIVGEDSFLQLQKLRSIIESLPPDVQRVDFDGATAELAEVLDELRLYAMFGGAKVVVLRNADEFVSRFREHVEDYLQHPAENSVFVLRFNTLPKTQRVYKFIDKAGKVEHCEKPTQAALPAWIQKHAASAYSLAVQSEAAAMLADLIGDNLGRLDTELAKLAITINPPAKLTAADVANLITFGREQEMWELTNALAQGNSTEAMKRWRQLMQTDPSSEFRATTWLTLWLEDVRYAISAKQSGERADPRKLWRYKGDQLRHFLANCDRLGPVGLQRAVDRLAEMDRNSKTGVGVASTNVERFILDSAT